MSYEEHVIWTNSTDLNFTNLKYHNAFKEGRLKKDIYIRMLRTPYCIKSLQTNNEDIQKLKAQT